MQTSANRSRSHCDSNDLISASFKSVDWKNVICCISYFD